MKNTELNPAWKPAAQAIYTCPMHPEVVQDHPGDCPKCGMALEPRTIVPESAADDAELRDLTRRFRWGALLTLPVFVVAMAHLVPAWRHAEWAVGEVSRWGQLLLTTPVVVWAGWPFFVRAWRSLLHRSLNMFTLIALGVGAAYLFSAAAMLVPQWFPPQAGHGGRPALYFEAAGVVTVLVLLGQMLELRARRRTGSALKALMGLAPKTARRVTSKGDEEVPLEAVKPGDLLRVRPGEKVPVDGIVVEGTTSIDESMLTGEPVPVTKELNSKLSGGTLNTSGGIVMRAERVGAETLLARIVDLVAQAQRSRAPIQSFADRVAASLEQASEHPLARAVTQAARESHLPLTSPAMFQSRTGSGVSGTVDGHQILVGNGRFLRDRGATGVDSLETFAAEHQARGAIALFLAVDGRGAGTLIVEDPIKPSTPGALEDLRRLGVRIVMLTGDHARTAGAVAGSLGIAEVHAEVTPQQKLDHIVSLKGDSRVVGMAGDGINDAPALAAADVGIAMGSGTDIAMESAGVTLVKGDLGGIVRAIRLGRAMLTNIRQNLFFAFLYNGLGIPIAAGVLFPFFGILMNPMLAGVAMSLSSVSVIANALRLHRARIA